jgi:hypothetical protein
VQALDVDQVRSVEIAIAREPVNESRGRLDPYKRVENRRSLDDEHGSSLSVATGTNGFDDRLAVHAARARSRAAQQIRDRRPPG